MARYYLAPFVGSGRIIEHGDGTGTSDPFRPPTSQPYGIIDLRRDATNQAGWCLLWVPNQEVIPDAVDLGDVLVSNLPRSVTRNLENRLGITLGARTIADILPELLIAHATEFGPRWKPLRAGRDGFMRIHLGGLVYENRVSQGPGAAVSDNFDRADQSLDAGNWVEVAGNWSVVGNQAELSAATGTNYRSARYQTDLAGADHEFEVDVPNLPFRSNGVDGYSGAAARFAAAAQTYYLAAIHEKAGGLGTSVGKVVTGVFTELASTTDTGITSGANIRCQVSGSTIKSFLNDVEVNSVTDTDITSGLRGGLFGVRRTSAVAWRQDNFAGADLSAATNLVIQAGTHGHSAESLSLTQSHELGVQAGIHGHTGQNLALTQVHELGVAASVHGHTAENLTLDVAASLDIFSGAHDHTAENLGLTQVHSLAVDASSLAHAAENVALSQLHLLALQDGLHDHTAENISFTGEASLVVSPGNHGHTAQNVVLGQIHDLLVAAGLHAHTADNLNLAGVAELSIQDGAHGHQAQSLLLTQLHVLGVHAALHGHTAAQVVLTQLHELAVQSGLHSHAGQNVVLSQGVLGVPVLGARASLDVGAASATWAGGGTGAGGGSGGGEAG